MNIPFAQNVHALLAMSPPPVDPKTGQAPSPPEHHGRPDAPDGRPVLLPHPPPPVPGQEGAGPDDGRPQSGDEIVTSSGILGTITNVKDKTVVVRIADNVKIEVLKTAVSSVAKAPGEEKSL